ncbi:Alpha/Beta hydrolase protein [Absidia repens]|uniref:sn-1-specific diacylglycerol lipase n=1 Tax=Absidia repens TaxID=90262 RepID=A0A1X2IM59_9FUNG|nr:Alpha/Beta hydrolase protein [Absidia repens]
MSFDWLTALLHPNKDDHSARGRRYGFQQNDTDNGDDEEGTKKKNSSSNHQDTNEKEHGRACRLTHKAKKKARHIISSVEFGDKSFGSRWMQDSFEVVALSHPVADHLIGLAVKTQTQALVRAIIVLANSFGQGFKVTAIQLVKAMLLLERFYRSLPKQVPSNEIKDRYIIDIGNHYFRYALVAYGWRGLAYLGLYGQLIRRSGGKSRSNRLAILNYLRVESGDLLGYEYGLREGAAFQPSYFVAVDRPKKSIVLSIRGTWSLYDAITDLVCYYVPWKGGLVHSGMLASAQWIFIHIVPQIFRYIHLHRQFLKGFVITGHSLGGGAASLLTMMVADELETLQKLADNPDFQLRCYSYAPVALVSYELACKYDQYIHSFIVQDDIVGRLSYGTALKLKELILDTISAYEALGGMAKVVTNSKSRKLCYDLIDKCRALIFKSTSEAPPVVRQNKREIYNDQVH